MLKSTDIIGDTVDNMNTNILDTERSIKEEKNISTHSNNSKKSGYSLMKGSVYNRDIWVHRCGICGIIANSIVDAERNFDIHHIDFQCEANEWGRIGVSYKNHLSNLVVLCKDDHHRVHEKKILIHGWVKTSVGMVLNWKEVDDGDVVPESHPKKWTKEMIADLVELKPFWGTLTNDAMIQKIFNETGYRITIAQLTLFWGIPPIARGILLRKRK